MLAHDLLKIKEILKIRLMGFVLSVLTKRRYFSLDTRYKFVKLDKKIIADNFRFSKFFITLLLVCVIYENRFRIIGAMVVGQSENKKPSRLTVKIVLIIINNGTVVAVKSRCNKRCSALGDLSTVI